jgi:type IV pilus assembly protein PilA
VEHPANIPRRQCHRRVAGGRQIVNNYVSSVAVQGGAIHVTFGNRANGAIKGRILTVRPAIVEGEPVVPVTWVCGYAGPPEKMTVKGDNKTNVPAEYLPMKCRSIPT